MYEGMKSAPIFEKGLFRASKKAKEQLGTPAEMCFLSFQTK